MLTTTLNAIRDHSPCADGWSKLLAYLGKTKADDEPLLLETVLNSNGLDDALWCLRALGKEHDRACRLFAVWCARKVQHLMTDPSSIDAIGVSERYANGTATDHELSAARSAAWSAARAAESAAWSAALSAARAAAWSAALSAERSAALSAARSAARAEQSNKLREICRAGKFV